ncbi:hypothetical protein N1851_012082 [Merluccius polli]|uniref:Uncharacterized protein n=1 Tax=Merluccius polli TaxID=89951 RepID=A0AA47MX12_MERPO|nr:hypothetical protein N1851_012082 [Merluccius polli]
MDVTSATKRVSVNLIEWHFLRSMQLTVLDKQQMKNTTSTTRPLQMLALTWSLASRMIICTWFAWASLRFVDQHHWPPLPALRNYIPSEFARRPRALAERCRWKATELRQFLLYTGPVVLRGVLQPQIYDNFMLLSVGVYILASPKYFMEMNELANTLLVSFVEHFGQLYGESFGFITFMVWCISVMSKSTAI